MAEHEVAASEAYDRWAPVYDGDGNPLVALDDAVVPALFGEVQGLRMADLACGTGRHSRRLLDAGARVTSVDFSPGMLAEAKKRLAGRDVTFLTHDLREPLPFANASFDGVVCCLALEHLADLHAFFREARRICKEGGFVVCSDMHPWMRLRGKQASFDDAATGAKVSVEGYEHPVSEYVMAALEAGLLIEAISEHKGDAALSQAFPRIAKYVGWPMLVSMRLRVPGPVRR
jgi:ubiquinone/menaquinone biosynthesis C-methylase UbiE